MSESHIHWLAPAPFWRLAAQGVQPAPLGSPQLLRFASDSFMDELMALLEHEPERLGELRARPESWRYPQVSPAPANVEQAHVRVLTGGSCPARRLARLQALRKAGVEEPAAASADDERVPPMPLKLYQPGHQRYYLVGASLVCRVPGMPDRILDPGAQERVSFVVRRLRPRSAMADLITPPALQDCDEYALLGEGPDSRWEKIGPAKEAAKLEIGEEQLPLFGVCFRDETCRRRRLLAGLVPAGRRESYIAAVERAQAAEADDPPVVMDPREALLRAQVIEPCQQLIERVELIRQRAQPEENSSVKTDGDGPGEDRKSQYKEAREQSQELSWYILLDFAAFLKDFLPAVWKKVCGETPPRELYDEERELIKFLGEVRLTTELKNALAAGGTYAISDCWGSLLAALAAIDNHSDLLGDVTDAYDRDSATARAAWPPKLFPLADPEHVGPLYDATSDEPRSSQLEAAITAERTHPLDDPEGKKGLAQYVVAALQHEDPPQRTPPLPLAARVGVATADPAWFVIRCVFERPACGPVAPAIVSDPTEPFQLAGFFDPDAPARPIRIGLPVDISPGGLRKFDKNTAFIISDMLCGQIRRLRKLTFGDLVRSVLPWPFHKDLPGARAAPCSKGGSSFGMICSLSIPIITICALILLMIIVSLLDIIFHWIPFFILCFRLPGFTARSKDRD